MNLWHYFAEGNVVGPLEEDQLLLAVEQGKISLDTLVYAPEFGPDVPENWKQLGETELAKKASQIIAATNSLVQGLEEIPHSIELREVEDQHKFEDYGHNNGAQTQGVEHSKSELSSSQHDHTTAEPTGNRLRQSMQGLKWMILVAFVLFSAWFSNIIGGGSAGGIALVALW